MNDLVGIRYTDNGLTPESGFDCYGLVRWVLMQGLGKDLPAKPPPAFRWREHVLIYQPRPPLILTYDILMFAELLPGIVNHIGIAISSKDFIHTGPQFGGVVCQPINYVYEKITGVGRPHDH
jgi:cell wall-associated NlpC family hydrolase